VKLILWTGLGVLFLAPALAGITSAAWGRDVVLIVPVDADLVALNRMDWTKGQPIAPIYGTPIQQVRVVFPNPEKLIHPLEDPSIALYKNERGDHPLQAQTLWFFARWIALAGLALAAIGAAFSID
jgi:hypothetical protein